MKSPHYQHWQRLKAEDKELGELMDAEYDAWIKWEITQPEVLFTLRQELWEPCLH